MFLYGWKNLKTGDHGIAMIDNRHKTIRAAKKFRETYGHDSPILREKAYKTFVQLMKEWSNDSYAYWPISEK